MTTSRPLRVLVVDDHPDGGESCAELLRLMGHDARAAQSGAAALRTVAGFDPDVALLDLGLPDGDGFGLVGRLLAALPRRPVLVAVTGYGHLEARARQAGFDHYLLKPVELAVLTDLLDRTAGRGGS
ncbi:response regulator [bacterium]|nr:response regulator [bacterium]